MISKKTLRLLLIVSVAGIVFTFFFNKIPAIKQILDAVLNPTAGILLNWNLSIGFLILIALISLILTIVQKYTTDQETLKLLRKEQKLLQEEGRKFREHPEKVMEIQKKSLELAGKTMDLTISSTIYTFVPIILLFRWFSDYFVIHNEKIFGFFGWIWAYIIFSIIFSMIYRKFFDMP